MMRVSGVCLSADGLAERPTAAFVVEERKATSSDPEDERGEDVGDGERRRA